MASAATPNDSCLYEGIYSPSRGAWEGAWFEQNWEMAYQAPAYAQNQGYANQPREMCQFTHADNWLTCGYGCQPANQSGTGPALTPGNEISIGMFARRDGVPSSSNPNLEDFAYSGSVDWQESDMGRPSFDPSTIPQSDTQWVDGVSRSLSPTATDGGLGVKTAELSTPNTSGGSTVTRSDVSCYGNRDYRCPQRITLDNSTPFYYAAQPLSYNTANMPEGINTLGLAAVDVVGNASAGTSTNPDFTANQWTVKVDRTPPSIDALSGSLWDHRNQATDHRGEGLYDSAYPLHVSASDRYAGVSSIEVQVDGNTQASRGGLATQTSTSDGAGLSLDWTLHADNYADGDHTVTVITKDRLAGQPGVTDRHTTTQTFVVSIGRHGDIYHASRYDADPSATGNLLDQEWARLQGDDVRKQETDAIQTRTTVGCLAAPLGCDETRQTSLDRSSDPTQPNTLAIYQGASPSDARLDSVADVWSIPRAVAGQAPTSTEDLISALQPWQRPPPGHGSSFEVYQLTEPDQSPSGDPGTQSSDTYVDAATHLPLKRLITTASGATITTYFTYDTQRALTSQVPADFFSVSASASNDIVKRVTFTGAGPTGVVTDSDGTTFDGWALRGPLLLNGLAPCLITSDTMAQHDPNSYPPTINGETADPGGDLLDVRYMYSLGDTKCSAGNGDLADPALVVTTSSLSSAIGHLRHDTFYGAAADADAEPGSDAAARAVLFQL